MWGVSYFLVSYTVLWTEGLLVKPFLSGNPIIIRNSACVQGGDGRGTVNGSEVVSSIREYLPFCQQVMPQTVLPGLVTGNG